MGHTVVETGNQFPTLQTAIASKTPDMPTITIVSDPGRYPGDTLVTSVPFTLKVDRGEVVLNSIVNGKSAIVLGAGPGPVVIEDYVGDAIKNSSGNGGLVRSDLTGRLTLRRCRGLPKCETWLLTGASSPNAVIELIDCWVYQAGDGTGQSHAVYVASGAEFIVTGGYYADTDGWGTGSAGHLLKWLTPKAWIINTHLPEGRASRALSAEYGGEVIIDGSTYIEQDIIATGNSDIIGFGGQLPIVGGVRVPKYEINSVYIGRHVQIVGASAAGPVHTYIPCSITDLRGQPVPPVIDSVSRYYSIMEETDGPYKGNLVWEKETPGPAPEPVPEVLSQWGPYSPVGPLQPCEDGQRIVTKKRSRVILTYPAFNDVNPDDLVLQEEVSEVQACTPIDEDAPEWMPEKGRIKAISLNLLKDVDPCPARNCVYSGVAGIYGTFDWCGTGFAPTVGKYGSYIHAGGGHNSNYDNGIYQYELESQTFARRKDPYVFIKPATGPIMSDPITCEFLDANGQPVPGEPFTAHTYDTVKFIPPDVLGTNEKGYMYFGMWQTSSVPNYGPQRYWVNLDNMKWEECGQPSPAGVRWLHHPAVFDSKRKRIVESREGNLTPYGLDLVTGTWSQLHPSVMFASYDSNADYDAHDDLYVSMLPGPNGWGLALWNPVSFAKKIPQITGEVPNVMGGGEWVESRRGYYFYSGVGPSDTGDRTVLKVEPTGDPWNDPWRGIKETLSADEIVPQRVGHIRHYSRFRYVPALDIFVWLAGARDKVFAFNPTI